MTRIAVLVTSASTRRILDETLGRLYDLVISAHYDACRAIHPEIIIIDSTQYAHCAGALERHRQAVFPAIRPTLLIASASSTVLSTHRLWETIEDVIHPPINKAELKARVGNLVKLYLLSKEQASRSDTLAINNRLLADELRRKTGAIRESFQESVQLLIKAAEYRDEETGSHIERTAHYCKHMSSLMGGDREFQETLFYAAPMHDVGKIGIPDAILLKPGKLDDEELRIMRSHCELGEHILSSGASPYAKMGRQIAAAHHEHWDGSGYPNRLQAEEIPLSARIMALADVYDALRSPRPYKPPLPHTKAVVIISKGDGYTRPDHFDPEVISAFRKHHADFNDIYAAFS